MLTLVELCLVVITTALAFGFPELGSDWFCIAEQRFADLARRRTLSVLLVLFTALVARAAVLPVLPVPEPRVDDEFGYLLAADTFVHGRLTNPTHPMWIHFESFSIIEKPTYQCFAQPAQGLLLAAGKAVGGYPFVGVWLGVALMCAAICWMLQEWVAQEWALLGGLLAVMRFGVFSYWASSYFGAAVAATGGALVLGALPRVMRSERVRDALLMGLGLAVLASSRPYEGLIFSVPVAIALLIWLSKKKRPDLWTAARRIVLPLSVVVSLAAFAMGYYFWRVTGSAFLMPYQVNRATYGVAPYLLWQSPKPAPIYHHEALREFYLFFELPFYTQTRSVGGLFATWVLRARDTWFFFFGPALSLPLLMAMATTPYGFPWLQLSWETRFLLLAGAASIAGLAVEVFYSPHYAAPMTCLILGIVLLAMRHVRGWRWRGKPAGLFLTRAVPLICLLMLLVRSSAGWLHISLDPVWPPTSYNAYSVETLRGRIRAELDRSPGRHLVIVRYKPHVDLAQDGVPHQWDHQWVYNEADIDAAKIVWAWDMGPAENEELINYFKDRRVWLVKTDASTPGLTPYSATPQP